MRSITKDERNGFIGWLIAMTALTVVYLIKPMEIGMVPAFVLGMLVAAIGYFAGYFIRPRV